ncbi:hypothetical protein C8R47DRAFT_1268679 [Mycena vitilis]|nr:hypothetical protein C8R47DRAFT_1268679 [Mycena vitilis]
MNAPQPYASVENAFSTRLLPSPNQKAELLGLLRANATPSDPSHFRSVTTSARREILRYNVDIWTLKEALDKLLAERETFKLHAAQCSSLFAPIRSLPPEILLKIFAYSSRPWDFRLAGELSSREHMERLAKAPFLKICRVCSAWRSIIMETPSLWAAIEINLNEWLLPSVERRAKPLLAVGIARTAACLLRVKVTATAFPYFGDSGMVLLGECSRRWRSAHLRLNAAAFRAISFTRGNFPLLETLYLDSQSLPEVNIFEVAPRLRAVTLRAYGAIGPLSLPWEQLTTLNYTGDPRDPPGLRPFMGLIHRCTSLTAVTLLIDISTLSLPHAALASVNTNLTCLAITLRNTRCSDSIHATQAFTVILGAFTLPSISKLDLRMNSPMPLVWPQGDFQAFAARSSFRDTITSLAFHGILILDLELLICIREAPQLQSLSIADVPRADDNSPDHVIVTDALLVHLTNAHLIPHLHVLEIASLLRFTPQKLLNFVASRIQSGRTTAGPFKLEVYWNPHFGPSPNAALVEQLDSLQRHRIIAYSMAPSADAFREEW